MPTGTLPLPAEITAGFGPSTRESLTGEPDRYSGYKDQAELTWEELILRFWQGQLSRIMRLVQARETAGKALLYVSLTSAPGGRRPAIKRKPPLEADPFSTYLFTEEFYAEEFWEDENKQLLGVIGPQVSKDVQIGAMGVAGEFQHLGIQLDWTMVNTDAAKWARKHAGKLIKDIDPKTRKAVGEAVGYWLETPGTTHQDLQNKLIDLAYPQWRAELIARTEVTRSYAEGAIIAARHGESWKTFPQFAGLHRYIKVWQTKNDHVVCPTCERLHLAEVEGSTSEFPSDVGPLRAPPAHPG